MNPDTVDSLARSASIIGGALGTIWLLSRVVLRLVATGLSRFDTEIHTARADTKHAREEAAHSRADVARLEGELEAERLSCARQIAELRNEVAQLKIQINRPPTTRTRREDDHR